MVTRSFEEWPPEGGPFDAVVAFNSLHWIHPPRAVGFEGGPPPPAEAVRPWPSPPEAGTFFQEIAARSYPFQVVYPAQDYLANLRTQSGVRRLGEQRRSEFLDRVRRRLAAWPRVTATFVGLLTVGQKVEGDSGPVVEGR